MTYGPKRRLSISRRSGLGTTRFQILRTRLLGRYKCVNSGLFSRRAIRSRFARRKVYLWRIPLHSCVAHIRPNSQDVQETICSFAQQRRGRIISLHAGLRIRWFTRASMFGLRVWRQYPVILLGATPSVSDAT